MNEKCVAVSWSTETSINSIQWVFDLCIVESIHERETILQTGMHSIGSKIKQAYFAIYQPFK